MKDMNDIEIIPTCVPQSADDVVRYGSRAGKIAPAIHLDIDDGVFTPEYSWPFLEAGRAGDVDAFALRGVVFDAHLMVSDCRELGRIFINAGARSIIAHAEAHDMNPKTLRDWEAAGTRAIGIATLIDTDLQSLNPLLPFCDFLHVMSVATIGAQGAAFDPRAIERVRLLHQDHPDLPIEVDGGVSRETIALLVQAGATRFAVGSAIAAAPDSTEAYAELISLARAAL